MKFKLITGRTLSQGTGKEKGKFTDDYIAETSSCQIDPDDMRSLSLLEGETIKVKTTFGEAKVVAKSSRQAPHKGIIFIPYGPTASLLIGPETDGSGMPTYKGIEAEIRKGDAS